MVTPFGRIGADVVETEDTTGAEIAPPPELLVAACV
jgi:hypothetical protein